MTPETAQALACETSLALSRLVREAREQKGWTQTQLADFLGKKQPQVARLETGSGVTFDAQFLALYAMGVTPREIGERIALVGVKEEELCLTL